MKHLSLLLLIMATLSVSCSASAGKNEAEKAAQAQVMSYECDTITSPKGRDVKIYFIKHASLILDIDGRLVYIDPVTMFDDDFSTQPKADLLLVTHSHHDHLDKAAVDQLLGSDTRLYGGGDVKSQDDRFSAVVPGDVISDTCANFTITCTAAYNTSSDHLQFHPKDRQDVGFIFDIDGMRIYVAGDTEVIPEMSQLGNVDVAFLPINQPYTMTPQQAIEATEIIRPRILYPYHYSDTDLAPLFDHFAPYDSIEVRDRNMQ